MKKEKWIAACFITGCLFVLTGCIGTTELSEDESNLISRYAAGVLLNHSEEYQGRLAADSVPVEASPIPTIMPTPEVAVETPFVTNEPSKQGTEGETGGNSEIGQSDTVQDITDKRNVNTENFGDIYKLKGIDFSYTGYTFCESYPKNDSIYQIVSNEEESLLVVKFKVHNATSKKKSVNLIKRKINYELDADGSTYKPTISMLENGGLNFLKTKLKAGRKEEAVLIYSVPQKVKKAQSLSIFVSDGKQTANVRLN